MPSTGLDIPEIAMWNFRIFKKVENSVHGQMNGRVSSKCGRHNIQLVDSRGSARLDRKYNYTAIRLTRQG